MTRETYLLVHPTDKHLAVSVQEYPDDGHIPCYKININNSVFELPCVEVGIYSEDFKDKGGELYYKDLKVMNVRSYLLGNSFIKGRTVEIVFESSPDGIFDGPKIYWDENKQDQSNLNQTENQDV